MLRFGLVPAIVALLAGSPHAQGSVPGHLHVEVGAAGWTVEARDVPLRSVLEEIARHAGMTLETGSALDEGVTLELAAASLHETVHRVLRERGYLLSGAPPDRLWVFPSGVTEPPGDAEESRESAEPPQHLGLGLDDADPEVRLEAVADVARSAGEHAVQTLARAALFDPDPAVREEAVYGLGTTRDPAGSLGILERVLSDTDPIVREAAVEILAEIGGDDSALALAFALNDDDLSIREGVVHALAEIGGESAVRLLNRALADENDTIREAAGEALESMADR